MSVKHQSSTTLICDGCKKIEHFTGTHSKKTLRTWSRPHGWHTRPDDRDVCSSCWDRGER